MNNSHKNIDERLDFEFKKLQRFVATDRVSGSSIDLTEGVFTKMETPDGVNIGRSKIIHSDEYCTVSLAVVEKDHPDISWQQYSNRLNISFIRGSGSYIFSDEVVEIKRGQDLIISPDRKFKFRLRAGTEMVIVWIPPLRLLK